MSKDRSPRADCSTTMGTSIIDSRMGELLCVVVKKKGLRPCAACPVAGAGLQVACIRSGVSGRVHQEAAVVGRFPGGLHPRIGQQDRKSTRLNSSHLVISYAVFCLKKKKK